MKSVLTYACLLTVALTTGCAETGKAAAFQTLRQHSKYDCELGSTNDCPRDPGNYRDYQDEREQLLREEKDKRQ
jgi:hypothetical protein